MSTNKLSISTWQDDAIMEWHACFGDYDEGCRMGSGKTEAEAICDLIDMAEGDGKKGTEGRVSDRYGKQVRA